MITGTLKVLSTVGIIGGTTWVFDLYNTIPEWASKPAIEEMRTIVASAKHWDITTDRLTRDVERLEIKVESYKKYLDDNFQSPVLSTDQQRHKLFLEQQLDQDSIELEKKQRLLEAADKEDQALLKELNRA